MANVKVKHLTFYRKWRLCIHPLRTTEEIDSFQDLTRQLQQTKKKLEMYENKEAGKETTSMGSRTSSTTSLETMNNQHGGVVKTPTEPTAPVSNNIPNCLKGKSL